MQKRVHVAEEVEIAKESVQKTQQVTGTVRREIVDVQDNSQVDVRDGESGTTAAGSATSGAGSMAKDAADKGKDLLGRAIDAVASDAVKGAGDDLISETDRWVRIHSPLIHSRAWSLHPSPLPSRRERVNSRDESCFRKELSP